MNVRKREKKEIASRSPRHQKRDTFFISYLAYEKKTARRRQRVLRKGMRKLLGTVQRSEIVLSGNLPEGLG